MKKLISLLLVLMMLLSFSPAAFAANNAGTYAAENDWVDDLLLWLLKVTELFYNSHESEGIVMDNGHLYGCPGGDCQCLEIIVMGEAEYRYKLWEESLRVWIKSSRDDELVRHDLVVTEIERPYDEEGRQENIAYLEENEAVYKLMQEFFDEEELGDRLYRTTGFINSQVKGSCMYIEEDRPGGKIHVEYRLMDLGPSLLSVPGMGLVDESAGDGEENYVFVCEPFYAEGYYVPEHDLYFRAGDLTLKLPGECIGKSFALALSFKDNGSVRLLLADKDGKLIPGAAVSVALPEDAPSSAKAAVMDANGALKALNDSLTESGRVAFTAPTGDDVFALVEK